MNNNVSAGYSFNTLGKRKENNYDVQSPIPDVPDVFDHGLTKK